MKVLEELSKCLLISVCVPNLQFLFLMIFSSAVRCFCSTDRSRQMNKEGTAQTEHLPSTVLWSHVIKFVVRSPEPVLLTDFLQLHVENCGLKLKVDILWILPPCSAWNGSRRVLRNVDIVPQLCTASQLSRSRRESSSLWEPQISYGLKFQNKSDLHFAK
jgi:hypothetical protein